MRKSTLDEFIEKAREAHGDKYDYSKVEYINNKTKVCIICPEHGEFWQTPDQHLRTNGCDKCGRQTTKLKLTQSTKEFIEKAQKVHGDKYDYSKVKYINKRTKVCIICPEHGEFWQRPDIHVGGHGCQKCALKQNSKPKCTNWQERCYKKFGDHYQYNFIGDEKGTCKIAIHCNIHDYDFYQILSYHLGSENGGCPLCSNGKLFYNTETFIMKAKEVWGDEYNYNKVVYNGHDKPVCITCKTHGDFLQKPVNHLQHSGCPYCGKWKTQKLVLELLKNNFPKETWQWEYRSDWLGRQSIDIYNEKHKLAIEYNGEQHYRPIHFFGGEDKFFKRVELDKLKQQLINDNGGRLYTIKYDEFNTEKIIDDIKKLLYNEDS